MKVAIYHDFLVRMGGAEEVLATLLSMFPDADLYTTYYDKKAYNKRFEGRPKPIVVKSAQRRYHLLSRLPLVKRISTKLFLSKMPAYIESVNLADYDLVIANSSAWCHGLITPERTHFVVYMHSPMRFVWDAYHNYKRSFSRPQSFKDTFLTKSLHKTRLWDSLASMRESLLICNSQLVASRIKKFYRRDDAHVIYPPIAVDHIPLSQHKRGKELLILSTLSSYKNIDTWVTYCRNHHIKLVIAGDGPDKARLQQLASPDVTFLGYVTYEQKVKLLQTCRALIYPSKEDFGIGPLEALAAGAPVIALGQGGVLETIEHMKTGVLYPENSPQDCARALDDLQEFEASYKPSLLRKHAQSFSEATFKEQFFELLRMHHITP